MFVIGWSELLVIGVVALIAIGPKELPGVLRTMGAWMGKIRRMASEFQGQFHDAMREIEMADLKKQVDEATSGLDTKFDPLDFSNISWKPNDDKAAETVAAEVSAAATPPSGTPEPPAVTEPAPSLEPAGFAGGDAAPSPTGEGSRPV